MSALSTVRKAWPLVAAAAAAVSPAAAAAVTAAAASVTAAVAAALPYVAIVAAVAAAIRAHVKSIKGSWDNRDRCERLALAWAAAAAFERRALVRREEVPTGGWPECWSLKKAAKFNGRELVRIAPGVHVRRDAPETGGPTWLGDPGPNKAAGGTDYAPVWWVGGPWAVQVGGFLRPPGQGPTLSGFAPEAAAIATAAAEATASKPPPALVAGASTALRRIYAILRAKSLGQDFEGRPHTYYSADPANLKMLLTYLHALAATGGGEG